MNREFQTFNYFVDDLLSLDDNLLKCELDLLLMQHLFNEIDLKSFKDFNNQEDFVIAS